jgi:Ethanolamine utilization protein EutJ (predicted chaperonin)
VLLHFFRYAAGLNVVRIINEPTAAAIAYGLDKIALGSAAAVLTLCPGAVLFSDMLQA